MTYSVCWVCLSGCTGFNATPVNSEAHRKWVRYGHIGQIEAALGKSVLGSAYVDLDKKTCTIHSLNPRGLNDERTCTLGHEVKHCFDGQYHE